MKDHTSIISFLQADCVENPLTDVARERAGYSRSRSMRRSRRRSRPSSTSSPRSGWLTGGNASCAEALEITPLATLPFDPRCFGTASNTGRMLPDAPKGRQYGPLLRQMAETLAGRPLRKRRFGALGRLFGRKKSKK